MRRLSAFRVGVLALLVLSNTGLSCLTGSLQALGRAVAPKKQDAQAWVSHASIKQKYVGQLGQNMGHFLKTINFLHGHTAIKRTIMQPVMTWQMVLQPARKL